VPPHAPASRMSGTDKTSSAQIEQMVNGASIFASGHGEAAAGAAAPLRAPHDFKKASGTGRSDHRLTRGSSRRGPVRWRVTSNLHERHASRIRFRRVSR
jgi:hypothetical protein